MSKKHVKSTDPRKSSIVAALKRKSGAGKVTLLTETVTDTEHFFTGRCLEKFPGARWTGFGVLGNFSVNASELLPAHIHHGTQTGRLSCKEPNVSVLPKTEHAVSGKAQLITAVGPDAHGGYDVESAARGWYHTGTNSFDHPNIKHFHEGPPYSTDFGFGPFATSAEAKKDLLDMLRNDIDNLKYCAANARKLRSTT